MTVAYYFLPLLLIIKLSVLWFFLVFNKQKGSAVIKKLLESAIANAENNNNSDIDKLSVKSVIVNQGMRLKRMKPRARGRADRIIKPTCHIEIILVEGDK